MVEVSAVEGADGALVGAGSEFLGLEDCHDELQVGCH